MQRLYGGEGYLLSLKPEITDNDWYSCDLQSMGQGFNVT